MSSNDLPKAAAEAGIKLKQELVVDTSAHPEHRPGHGKSIEVITIVDGTVADVLPLIGYQQHDLNWLTDSDGVLRARPQVVQRLDAMAERKRGAYVLQEGQKLFGVVVDSSGGVKVIGHVKYLLPGKHQDKHYSGVSVKVNGDWQLCNPEDHPDVEGIVTQHGHVGVVHFDGFCLVEVEPEVLALLLEDAYFIVLDGFIDGFKTGECLLVANGAVVKRSAGFELISGDSTKINHSALRDVTELMVQFGDGKLQEDKMCAEELAGLNVGVPESEQSPAV